MQTEPEVLWQRCLDCVKGRIAEQHYKTWFAPIEFQSFSDNRLTIVVPTLYFQEYIEEHFLEPLATAIKSVFGEQTKLFYTYQVKKDEQPQNEDRVRQSSPDDKAKGEVRVASEGTTVQREEAFDSHLNGKLSFDTLIEGESNRLSYSIGLAVAQNPANTAFNPFFVYGPSGVGKTHLVNAIGLKVKELHPQLRVLYLSAHLFQTQFVDATQNNKVADFINFYQSVDVLILDDVQEFAGKEKTQNAFFHIFNHLRQNGRQLVLVADRPPLAMKGMEDRLLTRFKCGIVTLMERPGLELRQQILRSKVRANGLDISDEVIDYIAQHVTQNVRDLEGVVNSLLAYSVVYNSDINVELARRVVRHTVKVSQRTITVDMILDKTCEYFNVDIADVFSSSRRQCFVQARQMAMYLAHKLTGLSQARIGAVIGDRDHATVLHACRLVEKRLKAEDESWREAHDAIERSLRN